MKWLVSVAIILVASYPGKDETKGESCTRCALIPKHLIFHVFMMLLWSATNDEKIGEIQTKT
jgi:hypothetical protein